MPVALITGGAGTLGRAAARRLAQDGWAVVLADIDLAAARDVAASIGERASVIEADVTRLEQVRGAIEHALTRCGGLDAVIGAAGGRFGADVGPFMEASSGTWTSIIELHLTGVLNLYHAALPHMRAQRRGALLSISAVEAYRGMPASAAFSTAKAAVAVLTETLVRECKPDNIRVNTIIPPFPESLSRIGADQGASAVAEAIAFILSERAALTTGAALDVSNGWALH